MKTFLAGMAIFVVGVCVGCSLEHRAIAAAPFDGSAIPKTPPRIIDRFVITPCPDQWKNDPALCKWWESYQTLEEARHRELVAAINNGSNVTFEAVRGLAP